MDFYFETNLQKHFTSFYRGNRKVAYHIRPNDAKLPNLIPGSGCFGGVPKSGHWNCNNYMTLYGVLIRNVRQGSGRDVLSSSAAELL